MAIFLSLADLLQFGGKMLAEPCRRITGKFRAHFESREAAEAFASHPANVDYHGDIAHRCLICGWFHLSRPEWLVPHWAREMKIWN
jgi:hypothetical protein